MDRIPEKLRIRQRQKAKAAKKREEEKYENQMRLMRKARGRQRGHSDMPQIICHVTAERWKREGRKPKNNIVVSR